ELATLAREMIEDGLADIGNARRYVELLSEDGEAHRKAIEAGIAILLRPADLVQRGEEPMRAALGKRQALGNFPERQLARSIGKQLDDRETAFSGYVRHRQNLLRGSGSTPIAACCSASRCEERRQRLDLAGEHVTPVDPAATGLHRELNECRRCRADDDVADERSGIEGADRPGEPIVRPHA